MYTTRLAYVHLTVRQLEAAVTFYTRFLDLQLSERFGKTALLVSSETQPTTSWPLAKASRPVLLRLVLLLPPSKTLKQPRTLFVSRAFPASWKIGASPWCFACKTPTETRLSCF
jgi:catechol-2,3-dioxygenase